MKLIILFVLGLLTISSCSTNPSDILAGGLDSALLNYCETLDKQEAFEEDVVYLWIGKDSGECEVQLSSDEYISQRAAPKNYKGHFYMQEHPVVVVIEDEGCNLGFVKEDRLFKDIPKSPNSGFNIPRPDDGPTYTYSINDSGKIELIYVKYHF